MAKKKPFKRNPFRDWLDCLVAVVVKTRDNFTCQWRLSPDCQGTLMPGDNNIQACHIKSKGTCVLALRWDLLNIDTACGQCHAHMHANPDSFGVWFHGERPYVYEYLNEPRIAQKWNVDDYLDKEKELLLKSIELNVDCIVFPVRNDWRGRFIRRSQKLR